MRPCLTLCLVLAGCARERTPLPPETAALVRSVLAHEAASFTGARPHPLEEEIGDRFRITPAETGQSGAWDLARRPVFQARADATGEVIQFDVVEELDVRGAKATVRFATDFVKPGQLKGQLMYGGFHEDQYRFENGTWRFASGGPRYEY